MGVDYGSVRIGIAISDPMRIISSPYETYYRKDLGADISYFQNLIKLQQITTIVFGLPYNMDGSEGDTAFAVREFAEKISKVCACEIVFQDERLSSMEAEEILINANVKRDERKKLIDKIAAQIILQSYIERR